MIKLMVIAKRAVMLLFLIISFSSCKKSSVDEMNKIVLVHGENLDRCEMGQLIKSLSDCNPKVIGINFLFVGATDVCDSVLHREITKSNKVVLVEGFENNERVISEGMFANNTLIGLPGLIQNKEGVTDHYYRITNHLGGWEYSFPFQLALEYDTTHASQLAGKSTPNDYPINVYSNLSDFKKIKPDEVVSNRESIKDKIIIIGDLNEDDQKNYFKTLQADKSTQSTLSTVILANIVVDILQDLHTPNVQISKFSEMIRKQQSKRGRK